MSRNVEVDEQVFEQPLSFAGSTWINFIIGTATALVLAINSALMFFLQNRKRPQQLQQY
jgi:hypothetical protein